MILGWVDWRRAATSGAFLLWRLANVKLAVPSPVRNLR